MTGLATNFTIKNGKFTLSSGAQKARDSVNFYCKFDKNRVYLSEYGKNSVSLLHSLIQKPISYLQSNSTLILGMLQREVKKYVPGVEILDIDLGYFPENRKQYVIKIEYSSVQEDKSRIEDVVFV